MQEVVVLQMLVNGERADSNGRFIAVKISGPKAGEAEVEINSIRVYVPLSRVVDAKQYWNNKNGRT